MNAVIIIPARYKSSRFPGKPLVNILGKSLIRRVWEQCIKAIDSSNVFIATDDDRIKDHCLLNNMNWISTSENCLTGTDRVCEAFTRKNFNCDIIVNVQGDEPLISPDDIITVIKDHKNSSYVSCGYCEINNEEDFKNPNIIKVVMDYNENLLYASRSPIPINKNRQLIKADKQVCIYAFSMISLMDFNSTRKSKLEEIEDIEFLRFLEMGKKVKMVKVSNSSISVDIPEDVIKVENVLKGVSNES